MLRRVQYLCILEILVNLSQYLRTTGTFNDPVFRCLPRMVFFTIFTDNDSKHLTGSLVFLSLLLIIMFVFESNVSKHIKSIFFRALFSKALSLNYHLIAN